MSLRDYFAGQVAPVFLETYFRATAADQGWAEIYSVNINKLAAEESYAFADAMITAKEKEK
ncbi:MAG: hypothetical protein LBH43_11235 [Treponema sp.]|jgi:hypothetical protein|nr:hypothetical protein [Treponema sp.]